MSNLQEQHGKAFEYAFVIAVEMYLTSKGCAVRITMNGIFSNAKSKYEQLTVVEQTDYLAAAKKAAEFVIDNLEPLFVNFPAQVIVLSIQPDAKGGAGDVRDILSISQANLWEVGFSMKHNSKSIKSLRLNENFISTLVPGALASTTFLAKLADLKSQILRPKAGLAWKTAFYSLEKEVYQPVLYMVANEINNVLGQPGCATSIMKSLLGSEDCYKITHYPNQNIVSVEAININGSLNKNCGLITPAIAFGKLTAPTQVIKSQIKAKDGQRNTIEIHLDNLLLFDMRVHNKDTKVSASLLKAPKPGAKRQPKTGLCFEFSLVGYPSNYYIVSLSY